MTQQKRSKPLDSRTHKLRNKYNTLLVITRVGKLEKNLNAGKMSKNEAEKTIGSAYKTQIYTLKPFQCCVYEGHFQRQQRRNAKKQKCKKKSVAEKHIHLDLPAFH